MTLLKKKRNLASLRDDSRGSVFVEAALIMPLVVLFIAGIADYGLALYQYHTLSTANGSAVRQLIVSRGFDDPYAGVRDQYNDWAPNLTVTDDQITVSVEDSAGKMTPCTDEDKPKLQDFAGCCRRQASLRCSELPLRDDLHPKHGQPLPHPDRCNRNGRMMKRILRNLVRLRKDESGVALLYVTMTMPVMIALTSLAIDLGYVWYVKTRLQVAADMGALAGASKLYTDDEDAVKDLATAYVNLNLPTDWTGGSKPTATGDPVVDCVQEIADMGLTCSSLSGGNALRVTVTATAPLFFASALGFKTINLSAEALVTGGGSSPPPLNVAIVLDATASMGTFGGRMSTDCGSLIKPYRIECATLAAKTLLTKLWASVDQVALYTYPSFATSSKDIISCKPGATGSTNWVNYATANSPNYQLISFNSTYTDSGTPPGGLDTTNALVKALGRNATAAPKSNATTCNGLNSAAVGIGTSIADAILQAQRDLVAANAALVADGQPERQNVMIVLSDGDANGNSRSLSGPSSPDAFRDGTDIYGLTSSSWVIDVHGMMDQCQAAVTAADAAATAGTWVYSVAFAASYAAKGSCFTDRPVTTVIKTATSSPALTSADNIVTTRSCTSSNRCKAKAAAPDTRVTSTISNYTSTSSTTTQVATTTWGKTAVTTCTRSDGSSSGTCTTTLTPAKVQKDTYNLKVYDTTACKTMQDLASDPSKFYSTDGDTKCASAANPDFTDLVDIFNNVAASIMKKRRIPSSIGKS